MPLRIAIVGPGRVGCAFGLQLVRPAVAARVELLGFVGRRAASAAAAVERCGRGRVLGWHELRLAHVVVYATGDGDLAAAIASARAAGAVRACALWLHTSGRFGLDVFGPAALDGIRRGALHPVAPFADASAGALAMAGAPGVWLGDPRSCRLLPQLATLLGLVPVAGTPGDRTLYHAACALAANGLTALRSLVDRLFVASGALAPADAAQVAGALLRAALRSSEELGPARALSGPVRRGDAATVAAHLQAIDASVPPAAAAYRALMQEALVLARCDGLDPTAAAAVDRQLRGNPPGVQPPLVD